jgi:hypothetical protein
MSSLSDERSAGRARRRDPEELALEIAGTRDELNETLHELIARLSLRRALARLRARAGDTLRAAGRRVPRVPVSALWMGAATIAALGVARGRGLRYRRMSVRKAVGPRARSGMRPVLLGAAALAIGALLSLVPRRTRST